MDPDFDYHVDDLQSDIEERRSLGINFVIPPPSLLSDGQLTVESLMRFELYGDATAGHPNIAAGDSFTPAQLSELHAAKATIQGLRNKLGNDSRFWHCATMHAKTLSGRTQFEQRSMGLDEWLPLAQQAIDWCLNWESVNRKNVNCDSSKDDNELAKISSGLSWNSVLQLQTAANTFEHLLNEPAIPVWLSVQRHCDGFDHETLSTFWNGSKRLIHLSGVSFRDKDDPRWHISAFYPLYATGDIRYCAGHTFVDGVDTDKAAFMQRIVDVSSNASVACSGIELSSLGDGVNANADIEDFGLVHWVCVIHHLYKTGLLNAVEREHATPRPEPGETACTFPESRGKSTGTKRASEHWLRLRRNGFVWKIGNIVRSSLDATNILLAIPNMASINTHTNDDLNDEMLKRLRHIQRKKVFCGRIWKAYKAKQIEIGIQEHDIRKEDCFDIGVAHGWPANDLDTFVEYCTAGMRPNEKWTEWVRGTVGKKIPLEKFLS